MNSTEARAPVPPQGRPPLPSPEDDLPPWTAECDTLVDQVAARLRQALQSRPPETDPPAVGGRVACFTMVRDEPELIEPWIRYHASLFGAGRIFVLDNGSTCPRMRESLARAEEAGVHVVWDFDQRVHFERKGRLFTRLLRAIEAQLEHDFFMPLDCDEFVAARDPDGRVLCSRDEVTRHLRRHRADPNVLFISGSYFSLPGRPGMYFWQQEAKCFFAARTMASLHMGFHFGTARASNQRTDTAILHFHYRFKPYALYIEAAKRKLEARIASFTPEALADQSRTRNGHLTQYARMSEEEYLRNLSSRRDGLPINALERALEALGCPIVF